MEVFDNRFIRFGSEFLRTHLSPCVSLGYNTKLNIAVVHEDSELIQINLRPKNAGILSLEGSGNVQHTFQTPHLNADMSTK